MQGLPKRRKPLSTRCSLVPVANATRCLKNAIFSLRLSLIFPVFGMKGYNGVRVNTLCLPVRLLVTTREIRRGEGSVNF